MLYYYVVEMYDCRGAQSWWGAALACKPCYFEIYGHTGPYMNVWSTLT
jgi:hypothetical protein